MIIDDESVSKIHCKIEVLDSGLSEPFLTMESAGIAMTYNPEKQKQIVETFRKNYASLADILKQNGIEGEDAQKFMLAE